MSIGLFDEDRANYNHVIFNLDLMKISNYYKQKKEIVIMAPEFDPSRYSKIIVRKDYNDGIFNKDYFKNNIEYGGLAFTNNQYKSLPEDIELTTPDKWLYFKFQSVFGDTPVHKKIFKQMINFEHARISLDGKTAWDKAHVPLQINNKTTGIIFHDYNLPMIKDSFEKIQELLDRLNHNLINHCLVGNKFPIQLFNEIDFIKWTSLTPTAHFFNIKYNGLLNDEIYSDFVQKEGLKSLFNQFEYNVTYGCKDEEYFINNRMMKIYMQSLLAMKHNKRIHIIYEDDFFEHKVLENFIILLNYYINSRNKYRTLLKQNNYVDLGENFSLYNYVSCDKLYHFKCLPFGKQEIREIFYFIKEKNYEVFKKFYELGHRVELKGGNIVEQS